MPHGLCRLLLTTAAGPGCASPAFQFLPFCGRLPQAPRIFPRSSDRLVAFPPPELIRSLLQLPSYVHRRRLHRRGIFHSAVSRHWVCRGPEVQEPAVVPEHPAEIARKHSRRQPVLLRTYGAPSAYGCYHDATNDCNRREEERSLMEVGVAIVGLGNVGSGTLEILTENGREIEEKLGFKLRVKAISARSFENKQLHSLAPDVIRTTNWRDVCCHPEVDIVVELIGGTGVAAQLIESSLRAGKSVVTANKELMAMRGAELWNAANAAGVNLAME